MKAFYCHHFVLPLPEGHRFPMSKYALLHARVLDAAPALGIELVEPPAATSHGEAGVQGVARRCARLLRHPRLRGDDGRRRHFGGGAASAALPRFAYRSRIFVQYGTTTFAKARCESSVCLKNASFAA